MFFLQRKRFIDRRLDSAGLQTLLETWARLYHRLRAHAGHRSPGYCYLEAQVWGFPRDRGEELRQAVAQALPSSGLAGVEVCLRGPDTLCLSLPTWPAEPLPDYSRWLHFCLGWAEGMCLTLRCTIKDTPELGATGKGAASTLVFAGMVCGGVFLLKSLWPADQQERLYEAAAWPLEGKFLDLVDQPGEPDAGAWAGHIPGASSRASAGIDRLLTWILVQGPGPAEFLARVAACGGGAVLCGGLALSLRLPGLVSGALWIIAFLAGLGLLWTLGMKIWFLIMCKRLQHAGLKKVYSAPISHPVLDLTGSAGLQDPTVRKISQDLGDAGCRHSCDFGTEPPPVPGFYFSRLYLLPDGFGSAVFAPMFRAIDFEVFPARPVFVLTTYLADGRRVVTTNHQGGYRRPLKTIPVLGRGYPEVQDVATILQRHQDRLAKLAAEGALPVPLDPKTILKRMEAEHDEVRPAMAAAGYYSWGDALRETFGVVHPAYRD